MPPKKRARTQCMDESDGPVNQMHIKSKREEAKMLLDEKQDEKKAKAVALLEECVTLGDPDAMVMLAKCCAVGCGIEEDVERAKELISEAAMKRNKEAQSLLKIINALKQTRYIVPRCLCLIYD